MPIRLITFDLDDTLWESGPVLLNAEKAMLEWLRLHRPRLMEHFSTTQLRDFKAQLAAQQPGLAHRVSALRLETLRRALRLCGYDAESADQGAEEAFQVFFEARQQVVLFDQVLPCLQALKGRYRMGAITNGNADVRRLGLMDYFDFALCAEDHDCRKPEPGLFLNALERAGCAPDEALHVGDHPLDDMEGARACGFRTLWVNLRGKDWPAPWRPDAEIRDWREFPQVLRHLDL